MNKLANTYLDAVDSLLALHLKYPKPDDWIMVMSNLADAVRAMNQEDSKPIKPLTLDDVKRLVAELKQMESRILFRIGPFEARRRK